jgi:hypothetical protein
MLMPNVIMSFILSVTIKFIILNIVMLSVVVLNVVAPFPSCQTFRLALTKHLTNFLRSSLSFWVPYAETDEDYLSTFFVGKAP